MQLMEQELLSSGVPEFTHDFSEARITQSLVFCVVFCAFCPFPFGHCGVCPSISDI